MIHTFLVVVDVMIEILAKVNKSNGTISVALEFMGINRKAVILIKKTKFQHIFVDIIGIRHKVAIDFPCMM
jgi:hypothetical protein